MPNTPTYAFPYPAATDPPNGAGQIQSLANRMETVLSTTDANVLDINNNILKGNTAGHCARHNAGSFAVPANVDTKFTFDTSDSSCPEVTYSAGSFTLNKAGVWLIATGCRPQNSAGGDKLLWIGQGSSSTAQRKGFDSVTAGAVFQGMTISGAWRYSAGDAVAIWTYSSAAHTILNVDFTPWVSLTWLRP